MHTLEQDQSIAPSLKEVSARFEQWRSTRAKRGKIPNVLWQQVLALLNIYSRSELCKVLKLSSGQIKTKMQLHTADATVNINSKMRDFVAINIPQVTEEIDTQFTGRVEIKRPDGVVIFIERLNQQTLTQILTQFMQGLSC